MKQKQNPTAKVTEKKDQNSDKLGLDLELPSNYENSLGGHPKNLTDFEVQRAPGRL
ncbi:hypothetical protein ACFO25_17595 [Paenactinomyces guangxiensis]|uniref:Uncharacterized protein n=1 Tax=Paenactinomyces guangxiensis TaxID=1490290 RepID=A0A7W1WRH7_9BACL|nr:hypothetical protein [Paenactinomyces guangxiensis]MBA4494721.1 hypothetical protein [Paenactinomyces guangxiensis]MBH8591805.1 hypothetical protein [Paenactinomyces guangxiensis]